MLVLLLLSAAMGLFLLIAAGASSSTVSEASFKLPKRPRQRVRSPPAVDPVPATAPYIYSIGDDRIDKYLPCYNFGYEALREVEGTGPGALEHVIIYGKRLPGTRAPLHTHDHDAILCIVKGQLTLFTNDTVKAPSTTVTTGQCTYMPRGVVMAAANTGKTLASFYDIFDVDVGEPLITVREPICFDEVKGGAQVEYYRCT